MIPKGNEAGGLRGHQRRIWKRVTDITVTASSVRSAQVMQLQINVGVVPATALLTKKHCEVSGMRIFEGAAWVQTHDAQHGARGTRDRAPAGGCEASPCGSNKARTRI